MIEKKTVNINNEFHFSDTGKIDKLYPLHATYCRSSFQKILTVGQGPTALAVGAGGGCLDIFTLICPFSPLSPSLWERPDID